MRIIVTGMAGFIGFHAAKLLAEAGHEILGVDNINNYYIPTLKEARLAELENHPGNIRFQKSDLTDLEATQNIFKSFQPEAVLHLAAQAGVRYSIQNPHAYIQANIVAMMNILECCRHYNKPRLVYASSSSVYGGNKSLPFKETDRVDHPVSLYAASKKANELMAHTYSHLYQLQTIGLRFFTVYGPWGRPDMAMWLFADAVQAGRPIKVFNHGDMSRDFTFVDDIVRGVKAALEKPSFDLYEVFNLGNNNGERLLHLISIMEKHWGREVEKVMMPMQEGDVKDTFADISSAQRLLDFEPTTSIEDGVPRFLDWFAAHPQFHSKP